MQHHLGAKPVLCLWAQCPDDPFTFLPENLHLHSQPRQWGIQIWLTLQILGGQKISFLGGEILEWALLYFHLNLHVSTNGGFRFHFYHQSSRTVRIPGKGGKLSCAWPETSFSCLILFSFLEGRVGATPRGALDYSWFHCSFITQAGSAWVTLWSASDQPLLGYVKDQCLNSYAISPALTLFFMCHNGGVAPYVIIGWHNNAWAWRFPATS